MPHLKAAQILMRSAVLSLAFGLMALGSTPRAFSTESSETVDNSTTPSEKNRRSSKKKKPTGKQKDIEGTEALNRFEAETVIHSRYNLEGKSLEVDPD